MRPCQFDARDFDPPPFDALAGQDVGDTITLTQAGGGGVGDPKDGNREKVLADIRDGFVTVAGAERDYEAHVQPIKSTISTN